MKSKLGIEQKQLNAAVKGEGEIQTDEFGQTSETRHIKLEDKHIKDNAGIIVVRSNLVLLHSLNTSTWVSLLQIRGSNLLRSNSVESTQGLFGRAISSPPAPPVEQSCGKKAVRATTVRPRDVKTFKSYILAYEYAVRVVSEMHSGQTDKKPFCNLL
ncbi:hypothetical protein ACLOJK_013017 [Asimina triloba]